MPAPINKFKRDLEANKVLIGSWMGMGEAYTAEIMGKAGFDWLVIDGEHSPNDIRSIRDQLIALDASPSHPVVRVPIGETWIIKQVLDAGAQTVLVPMVDSAEEAQQMVRACRFPPHGDRGVGYMLARASGFGQATEYGETANDQICLLVQVETVEALNALDDILTVEGVDGVFIGPADLAASMGHLGNAMHPDVQAAIMDALARIRAAGKAAGILSVRDDMTKDAIAAGAQFVAVALDIAMLLNIAQATARKWQDHVK